MKGIWKKRIASIVLVLVMAVTLLPAVNVTAYAEEPANEQAITAVIDFSTEEGQEKYVFEDDGKLIISNDGDDYKIVFGGDGLEYDNDPCELALTGDSMNVSVITDNGYFLKQVKFILADDEGYFGFLKTYQWGRVNDNNWTVNATGYHYTFSDSYDYEAFTFDSGIDYFAMSVGTKEYPDYSVGISGIEITYGINAATPTITYEYNNGDPSSSVQSPTIVFPKQDPTSEEHQFAGWYMDKELTKAAVEGTAITEDTTLYAKWKDVFDQAISTADELNALFANGGSGYLTQNVIINGEEVVRGKGTAGKTVSLDLNGKKVIIRNGYLKIYEGSTFNLYDNSKNQLGRFLNTPYSSSKLTDAAIVNYGTFNMYGGTLNSLATGINAAGLYNCGAGTACIYGGRISESCMGIINWDGKVTITGNAQIAANETGIKNSGMIVVSGEASIVQNDGSGIVNYTDGNVTIEGDAEISDNGQGINNVYEDAKLTIGGRARIIGNYNERTETNANVVLRNGTQINIADDFAGQVGVQYLGQGSGTFTNALASDKSMYFTSDFQRYAVECDTDNGNRLSLVAKTVTYIVTFEANGHGTIPAFQTVASGGKVTEPEELTAEGYIFGGWYKDEACTTAWNFDKDTVTTDTTLYAKWTVKPADKYQVTFDVLDHGTAPDAQTVESGSKVTKPEDPTADGFIFGGWYKDEACTTAWNFDKDTVTTDTTLYAKWTPVTYAVTFEANGHGTAPAGQSIKSGSKAANPEVPTADGFTFGGWYQEKECTTAWDFENDTVTADTTLYAKWTLNVQGAIDFSSAAAQQEHVITAVEESQKRTMDVDSEFYTLHIEDDGETEAGQPGLEYYDDPYYLYIDGEETNFQIKAKEGYVISKITVHLAYDEESSGWYGFKSAYCISRSTKLLENNFAVSPANCNYEFADAHDAEVFYYVDGAAEVQLTADSSEYGAQVSWIEVSCSKLPVITYKYNNGSEDTQTSSQTIVFPNIPTWEGHTFVGWFMEKGCNTAAVAGTKLTADTILYAKWNENNFTIEDIADQIYTGSRIRPTLTVKDLSTGKVLTKGTDYFVGFMYNINVGTATVYVRGCGDYAKKTATKTFNILKSDALKICVMNTGEVVGDRTYEYTYNGYLQNTDTVVAMAGGKTLKGNVTYQYSTDNGKTWKTRESKTGIHWNEQDVCHKKIQVKAVSPNYEDAVCSIDLIITPADISDTTRFAWDEIADQYYTGTAVTPNLTITDKKADGELEKDTDYTVSYENNINVGTAKVTITGIGNYTGTLTKTFTINKAKKASDVIPEPGKIKDLTNSDNIEKASDSIDTKIQNDEDLQTLEDISDGDKETGVTTWLEIRDAAKTITAADKAKIDAALDGNTVGLYLDISLFKKVGSGEAEKVTRLNGNMKVSFVVPENLRKEGRTYSIIRLHDGRTTVIPGEYDAKTYTFTFESDQFSPYALIYKDAKAIDDDTAKNESVKTGDSNHPGFWFLLSAMAAVGGIGCAAAFKKKIFK